jgi:hypothetical protein
MFRPRKPDPLMRIPPRRSIPFGWAATLKAERYWAAMRARPFTADLAPPSGDTYVCTSSRMP